MAAYLVKRINHPRPDTAMSEPEGSATNGTEDYRTGITGSINSVLPFFTPALKCPAGTALQDTGKPLPKLFTPLRIRGLVMPNRIWIAPMCQYSAHEGFHTPWHLTHYGGLAQRGPGLMMVEGTAVQARGRITPQDSGIYLDAHVDTLRKHVQFAHSQKALIAIQLAHAGRKASTLAPWLSPGAAATREEGGWPHDVVGPTDEPFNEHYPKPRSLTLEEIEEVKEDFVKATLRALEAGFDVIELHFAHGYLVGSFLSPAVNKRQDRYGGSFENRTRLALEVVERVRAAMPDTMPLFVRISATDCLEDDPDVPESWTVEDSAKLAVLFAERGVDVLDASSGGAHSKQKTGGAFGYQVPFAKHIKKVVGDTLLVSAVGRITTGKLAEEIIAGNKTEDDVPLDLIAAGRMFQKNPGLVWAWADDLGVEVQIAPQIGWGFGGRAPRK